MTIYNEPGIDYDSPLSYGGTQSVVTSKELPSFMLKATTKAGVEGLLPQVIVDNMSFESNAPGAIKMSISEGMKNYSLVSEYTRIELLVDGKSVQDGMWLLRDSEYNEGVNRKTKAWSGVNFLWDRLGHTIVWQAWRHRYKLKSPGFMMNDLFLEAQSRGAMAGFTWDFTATHDSFGNAWPEQVSYEFKASVPYSKIAERLVEDRLIDIWQVGMKIVLATPSRGAPASPVLLVVGKDITNAPQKTSAGSVASHIMVVTEDQSIYFQTDQAVQSKFGYREELGVSSGGTTTPTFQAQALARQGNDIRTQRTYDVVMNPGRKWFPLRDYQIEQFIKVEHGGNLLALKVKQITIQVASGGVMSAGLVLNDKFLEFDLALAKAISGIQSGDIITGASKVSTPSDQLDQTVPAKAEGLSLATGVYQNTQGVTKAWVQAGWNPVLTNTDGTQIDDLDRYYVAWWYTDQLFSSHREIAVDAGNLTTMWDNLDPGREVAVYVYTKDSSGHQGSWTGIETIVTSRDTIPPEKPSMPILRSIMKQMVVGWDGKDFGGNNMAPDFKQIRVYCHINSAFDPANKTDGLFKGVLTSVGDLQITGFAIGDDISVRFVAEDISGNLSSPSDVSSLGVSGIAGPDIAPASITTNLIGAGAVQTLNLAAGAATVDKLTLGQTMNLVQDPGFGDAGFRTRRKTTEFTEKPAFWFFKTGTSIVRSGYYLQMLSISPGENQGKMYITDWIDVQFGEYYYARATVRNGEFSPNADARFHLGFEIEYRDGTKVTDYLEYDPDLAWTRVEFNLPMQANWGKIRFWIRPFNLNSGDIAVDDLEVRSGVGTTALEGSRILITPLALTGWDYNENKTFELTAFGGDFTARGTIKSGFTGKRIEINPGATYFPEMRFFPTSGDLYAYINSSDNASYPFIGVNAPDTGAASQTMTLFDDGFTIGEVDKSNGNIAGAAVRGEGAGFPAYLQLHGRLTVPTTGTETLGFYRHNLGTGGGAATMTIVLTRPPTPVAGAWSVVYSIRRAGTGQKISSHISAESGASTSVLVYTNDGGGFTSVNLYIHFFWVRSDGDA